MERTPPPQPASSLASSTRCRTQERRDDSHQVDPALDVVPVEPLTGYGNVPNLRVLHTHVALPHLTNAESKNLQEPGFWNESEPESRLQKPPRPRVLGFLESGFVDRCSENRSI